MRLAQDYHGVYIFATQNLLLRDRQVNLPCTWQIDRYPITGFKEKTSIEDNDEETYSPLIWLYRAKTEQEPEKVY